MNDRQNEIQPTVGRIVHYQAYGTPGGEYQSVPRAVIITEVHDMNCVGLCVLNPQGMFFNQRVNFGGPDKRIRSPSSTLKRPWCNTTLEV